MTPPRTPGSAPRLAPDGPAGLWQPLGPTTTLDGTGQHLPRSAGRCRDIAVHPRNTNRIYVASALGGLWYSETFGATWTHVGAFAALGDRTQLRPSSTSMSCGAVYVNWRDDEVWVGTGEPHPVHQPHDRGYQGQYAGVGIYFAARPVAAIRLDPNADPWRRQARPRTGYVGLHGASVFSFAADPTERRRIVAATTRGLHLHDPDAAPGTDPWRLVTVAAWDRAPGSPGSAGIVVTDVVWVPGSGAGRLWVAVRQPGTPLTGLWRSDDGPDGRFVEVRIGARTDAGEPAVDRIAIADAPGHPDVLYVMSTGTNAAPRLHRIDGAADVRRIRSRSRPGRPFFGDPRPGDPDQSGYDMAIAVDPEDPNRFMIGGAHTEAPDGSTGAALFRLTVPNVVPPAGGQWETDYAGYQGRDPTWVGGGIHANVHRIRWLAQQPPQGDHDVYVCTDGGVYHSFFPSGGDPGTYVSRATGMSATEAMFCASHPKTDGVVLCGVHGNGVQLRIGDGVWRRACTNGDGGGVAFDPHLPGRFIGQDNRSIWTDDDDTRLTPTLRTTENESYWAEHRAACFASNPAVIPNGAITQLAVGTRRVWYSEEWGLSSTARVALIERKWVSLPSMTIPRRHGRTFAGLDVLPPGPRPAGTIDTHATGIRVLRWAGVDRLYALMPGAVHRLDRVGGAWSRTQIEVRPTLPASGVPPRVPPMATGGPHLPPDGSLNDLAVHGTSAIPHGTFYVATSHPQEPVWWFNGVNKFHPCGLGASPPSLPPVVTPGRPGGIKATAYAVLVDDVDVSIVYVGTSIGVFQGQLRFGAGGQPSWTWHDMNNGLPEAAVQDLTITSWSLPQGGTLRLLRACLQSRGVWELELSPTATDVTYLRVHPYDTRRMVPTPMADPLFRADRPPRFWHMDWAYLRNRDHRMPAGDPAPHPDGTPREEFLWHASPDIRIRPEFGSAPLPAPAAGRTFPWTNGPPPAAAVLPTDRFALWAVQTALRGIDLHIVPNGVWSPDFERRLAAIRDDRNLLPAGAVVDDLLWYHPDVQAGFWGSPWAGSRPTEADLIERIVGMPTPRPGPAAVSGASVALPAGRSQVAVCVHRRGFAPAANEAVGLLLLRRRVTEPVAAWKTIPVPKVTGLAALDGLPSDGGALPGGVTLPAGWQVADTDHNVRRPPGSGLIGDRSRDVRAAESAVVEFSVDFSDQRGIWLLLALVRHGDGSPVLSGATRLAELVVRSPHVAARTVEVV